jgi:hypothetical protein
VAVSSIGREQMRRRPWKFSGSAFCRRKHFPMGMKFLVIVLLALNWRVGVADEVKPEHATSAPSDLTQPEKKTEIENGYNLLYDLKFKEARAQFAAWQEAHPEDPLSDVSIAVSYLFEEFYHHDVLTSKFFLDNDRLFGGIEGKPDENRTRQFNEACRRGRGRALEQLKANPNDADALFALTLATGMEANYAAMLEKNKRKSLRLMKEHEDQAKQLLELRPDCGDAWMAIGATNYLMGSLPGYIRFFLWFGRISGDKQYGMERLRVAAETGHYMRPFAKIFLALADLRENQKNEARELLSDLVREFPDNHLFADELARLTPGTKPPEKSEAR